MSPGSVPTERLPSEAELPLQLLHPAPIVIARRRAPRRATRGGQGLTTCGLGGTCGRLTTPCRLQARSLPPAPGTSRPAS